jgi:murein DD-endopeptidase MepM/ murein hydrolase activator NlpD
MTVKKITAVLLTVVLLSGVTTAKVLATPDEWIPEKGLYLDNDFKNVEDEQCVSKGAEAPGSYTVRKGDSLQLISKRFGMSVSELASLNNLADIDFIREGQVIVVPGSNSIYSVVPGDTLTCIALKTGVPVGNISGANSLQNKDLLAVGQKLIIPGVQINRGGFNTGTDYRGLPVGELEWPVVGWISSPFGFRDGRPHEGVDIAADYGTPIKASMSGRVVFAGPRGTYGLAVILDHGEGLRTLYAHSSKIIVSEGEWVNKGQVIALVGNTGRSRGPHVHMEVLINGLPYDPVLCLNRGSA